jgi:hypothetical protein
MDDQLQLADQVTSAAIDLAMNSGPKRFAAILEAFRSRDIVIPPPQREVRLLPA